MATKKETLKTFHNVQARWITNQINKGNATGIFLNADKAVSEFNLLIEEYGHLGGLILERFVTRYLSDAGLKKLLITLRVTKTRLQVSRNLQVPLSYEADKKLHFLLQKTGLTQIELIDKIILSADENNLIETEA